MLEKSECSGCKGSGIDCARELADKIFEGIALRVDQFFKAKNIQGGVMSGDDLFSPIDKYELAKSIDRYSEARLASARGQERVKPDQGYAAIYLDRELTAVKARAENAESKAEVLGSIYWKAMEEAGLDVDTAQRVEAIASAALHKEST